MPVARLRRTSWPARDISSNRTPIKRRSQTQAPSGKQRYKMEKVITPQRKARNPLTLNTYLFRTRLSTLEDSVLCAVNVEKHSGTNPHLSRTAEATLEKASVCVVKVGKPLVKSQPFISIKKFIQEQSRTGAASVENP